MNRFFASPLFLALPALLLGACSAEPAGSSEAAPQPTDSAAGPDSSANGGSPPASGLQFSPLKGAAKSVAESAKTEADAAFAAACACSGMTTGPCASGVFNWAVLQLSECYYAAFDADAEAVENVKVCLKQSLTSIQAQYEAQPNCGEQGAAFAELRIASELQSCGLVEPDLMPKLNVCDGAPMP